MEEEDKEVISYTINGISYAIWNADKEKFEYVRYKFGTSYIERLNCIEDVFIPYNEVNTILFQLVTNFLKGMGVMNYKVTEQDSLDNDIISN